MNYRAALVALLIAGLAAGSSLHVRAATSPSLSDIRDDPEGLPNLAVDTLRTSAPPPRAGNPLWAIPMDSLNSTLARPIFSPTRRPPPKAVAATTKDPVRQVAVVEPERPPLSLMGVVSGSSDGVAIFIEDASRNVVRLRTGEGFDGWILRSVEAREAILQRNNRTARFTLPSPTGDRK